MPTDPASLWTFVESGGLSAALFLGLSAVFWLYVKERDARTADMKMFAAESKKDLRDVLEVNGRVGQSINDNSNAVTSVHAKIDGLERKFDLLSARLDHRG